jgi:PhoH-like ATPase
MSNVVLIDTNLYLDDANIINKLSVNDGIILIPITVLKELDKHKYDKDLSYSARNAIQAILEFTTSNKDKTLFDIDNYNEFKEPDLKIIASAKKHNAKLATKDISMLIIADSMGLETVLHDIVLNNIFNPYIYMTMEELYKETDEDVFSYDSEYNDEEYDYMLNIFSSIAKRELSKDSWWFAMINVGTPNVVIYANNPIVNSLLRIDNKPKYRKFKNDKGINVKALDDYQICAIYAMVEAPNALICGSYGSGKSLLATTYAITNNDKKTFISRPNLTVDRRFELGFLPGSVTEKLSPWMAGFVSSLYHIFSNTKGQMSDKMSDSYDFVKETMFKKYFEMIPLDTLQGMSFMDGDLLLLDEAQLCSISILATILSRFGKGSKLIMTGDIKQVYGVIKPSENGLLKLLRLLPSKYMAYVELKNNYRSELLELAADLQDKTF